MLTKRQRRLVQLMLSLRLWMPDVSMRLVWFRARRGTRWLLELLLERQAVDDAHHAPCCPANHYHKRRLVFQRCSCGALLSENTGRG